MAQFFNTMSEVNVHVPTKGLLSLKKKKEKKPIDKLHLPYSRSVWRILFYFFGLLTLLITHDFLQLDRTQIIMWPTNDLGNKNIFLKKLNTRKKHALFIARSAEVTKVSKHG